MNLSPIESGCHLDERRTSVLAVTSELPWPLNTGGHIRSFHLLRSLAARFDLRLVAGVDSLNDPGIARLKEEGIRVCPVETGPRRPLAELFRVLDAATRFEPYVMFHRHNRAGLRSEVQRQLGLQTPDLVYLDHLDPFAFRNLFPNSQFVCDLHNVYSKLAARVGTERRWPVSSYLGREARLLAKMERLVAREASALMAVSADEQSEFQELGASNAHLVPNGVDCAAFSQFPVGRPSAPPVILYLGALSWQPNAKAAEFLARDVMPKILAEHPAARLTIVGRNPGPDVTVLSELPGVELHANVPDVGVYLRDSTVMAVPLDSGGGTRLKILEAFAAGLPVVSTPIGCEGIECAHGEHLWIGERDLFAESLLDVISSPQLATEFAERARTLAEITYDWPVIGELACAAVESAASFETRETSGSNSSAAAECVDARAV
jgi:glycosyltransferase involved in cell wall biosynthesis